MGYKLCGCEVLGCNEIDPRMNKVYVENLHPKYNYLEDIRDFNKREDLPEELYDLDLLDSSPPCSVYSTAGKRERDWGKAKKFREGQKEQTLDDLVFVSIETINKLRPKVAIIENVEGLLRGKAFAYVERIYKELNAIGYQVKHWLLKGEEMGVPQKRHRVFFVATRLDFDLNTINMKFDYEPILFGEVKEGKGTPPSEKAKLLLDEVKGCETLLANAHIRLYGKRSWFTHVLCRDDEVMPTVVAGHKCMWRFTEKEHCSNEDYRNASTFPRDYNFLDQDPSYICGMSVPPVMMKRVVTRLIESGLFDYKLKVGK